jgi:hypothetical protein
MDINLTGPIAAQIAANLAPTSGDNTVEVLGIIAAVIGVAGTLAGAYATNWFQSNQEREKLKRDQLEKKKDVFNNLTGKKPLMKQHYITLGESKISQKYYAKILNIPELKQIIIPDRIKQLIIPESIKGEFKPEDIYRDELNRWEEIEGDVTEEIASDNRDLYEILGFIQTSFPMVPIDLINDLKNADEKLNQKINTIEKEIEKFEDHLKDKVKTKESCWINFVNVEFCAKIEKLINRLREELAKEEI